MRVLLLMDYDPEEIIPFLIENPTEEQLKVLEAVNGKYLYENDEMKLVGDALTMTGEVCHVNTPQKWRHIWAEMGTIFPVGPVDRVFLFGMCT